MGALTWNLKGRRPEEIEVSGISGITVTPQWAWGGSTGAGVRVCIVDSGIEADHPLVGAVAGAYVVVGVGDRFEVQETPPIDRFGHGTACASIVRRIAPDCEIHSVRVLGDNGGGVGDALVAGLRWAVGQGYDLINLSLSTTRERYLPALRAIADDAYFGNTAVVASAHNATVESFPWRFSSVISVGSHQEADAGLMLYNPAPPVEFFAMGHRVEVAGLGGTTTCNTGNSFATPHVTGRCALILGKHPTLTPFQLKDILYLTSDNVRGNNG
ncbi:S8 family serine peptidase [Micromonospora carbonacea]|uniref:S8 family serine peptidase n=1 Tax=Micromonospora carbonacea TaxID=47853 RepID=UPI00331697DC